MTPDMFIAMQNMVFHYSIRLANGQTLTEDEAMYYFQLCNYLKKYARAQELLLDQAIFQEEARRDEENDSDGRPPQMSPPPS